MLEFQSILQFFFCPFACADIGDNAENRLFTIIVNKLGRNDGFNLFPLFVEEGIFVGLDIFSRHVAFKVGPDQIN
jgi:hypothetical protein